MVTRNRRGREIRATLARIVELYGDQSQPAGLWTGKFFSSSTRKFSIIGISKSYPYTMDKYKRQTTLFFWQWLMTYNVFYFMFYLVRDKASHPHFLFIVWYSTGTLLSLLPSTTPWKAIRIPKNSGKKVMIYSSSVEHIGLASLIDRLASKSVTTSIIMYNASYIWRRRLWIWFLILISNVFIGKLSIYPFHLGRFHYAL